MLEAYFERSERRRRRTARRPDAYAEWVGLLRACAAFEAYCRCYTADVRPERLAEFLLLNAEFPRSVRFAADRLEDSLRAIARAARPPGDRAARALRRPAAGRAQLRPDRRDHRRQPRRATSQSIRKQCDQIHTALYQTYITYPIEAAHRRGRARTRHAVSRSPSHPVRLHAPVCESVMELRMQPLERDGASSCLRFNVTTSQRARVFAYRDHFGNAVHYFDIPGHHSAARCLGRVGRGGAAGPDAARIGSPTTPGRRSMRWRRPASYLRLAAAEPVRARHAGADAVRARPSASTRTRRSADDAARLNTHGLRRIRATSRARRAWIRRLTRRSRARAGVCQDFAHIMTGARARRSASRAATSAATSRRASRGHDRAGDNATHAWIEACLPGPRLGRLRSDQQRARRPTATSPSPSAATTATCRRRGACSRATAAAS